MANYQQLKNALVDVIKQNGNNEITGEIMQTTLLSMINSLGANYQFAGILTPSTSFVPTDENIFYIGGAGSYSNFGATTINVPTGCVCIFTYNGSFASSILYVGGVVDISKLTNTTYASLSQALADVPLYLQVGGLEIMYQDSTSGTYVKYHLMATSWSTTESDWQGVDEEVKYGSRNLIESGAVAKVVGAEIVAGTQNVSNTDTTIIIRNEALSIKAGTKLIFHAPQIGTVANAYRLYINSTSVMAVDIDNEYYEYTLDNDCTIIVVKVLANKVILNGSAFPVSIYYGLGNVEIDKIKERVSNVEDETSDNTEKVEELETEIPLTKIIPSVTWNTGKYVIYEGYLAPATASKYSNPIPVKRNDLLIFNCYFGNIYLCPLAYVSKAGKAYNPVIRNENTSNVVTYKYRCPKDGSVVISTGTQLGGEVTIIRGMETTILQNDSNIVGITDLSLITRDSGNRFLVDECMNGIKYSSNHSTNLTDDYWTTGYIPTSDARILMINYNAFYNGFCYDKDYTLISVLDTRSPIVLPSNAMFIRLCYAKSYLPFEQRGKLIISSIVNDTLGQMPNLNSSYLKVKNDGYISKSDIAPYEATKVYGTYVSETVFNDVEGTVVVLNTSSVYIDTISNLIYRYNGTALQSLGVYDYKSLVFTNNFSISIPKNEERCENLIVTANAKYYIGSGITNKPTIKLTAKGDGTGNDYFTIDYVIGCKQNYSKKEWRAYPLSLTQKETVIDITIPTGVTLFIDDIGNYYSDKKGYYGFPRLDCRDCNAPDQSLAFMEQAVKLGYSSVIVIPKRTSDGVWVCFHDDDSVESARNEDGTVIQNPLPVSDYTYQQLLGFDIGISRSNDYQNVGWRGQKIPLLEDFLSMCAKTGIHPVFSIHPNFTSEEWAEVKALTDKYNVTSRLNLKSGWIGESLITLFPVFGNNVESYYGEINTDRDGVDEILQAITEHQIDVSRVRVGLEYFKEFITEARVQNALSNNIPVGLVSPLGEDYYYWLQRGVSSFTDEHNPSVGLNW